MNEVDLRRIKKSYAFEIGGFGEYSESFFSALFRRKRYLSDDELKIVEKKFGDIFELLISNKVDNEIISILRGLKKKILRKNRRIQWGDFQLLKGLLAGISPDGN